MVCADLPRKKTLRADSRTRISRLLLLVFSLFFFFHLFGPSNNFTSLLNSSWILWLPKLKTHSTCCRFACYFASFIAQGKKSSNNIKPNKMNDHNSNLCVRCNNSETSEYNTAKDMPNKMKRNEFKWNEKQCARYLYAVRLRASERNGRARNRNNGT